MIDLRLGRWQEVLSDVKECQSIITDPPYSERTHKGECSLIRDPARDRGASLPKNNISYRALTAEDVGDIANHWAARARQWVLLFGDVQSWLLHSEAWAAAGWCGFAPVVWVKANPPPRFSGDGPTSSCEYIFVARPRRRCEHPGSRPGHYHVLTQTGRGGHASGLVGTKDPDGMRAIIRDYTRPGDLIVDPFAGSGTTLIAARAEGRNCIGAEMDPETYRKAQARIAKPYTVSMGHRQRGPKPKTEEMW